MKKAILSIGLFTLVLASTSFASPKILVQVNANNSIYTPIDGSGGQDPGRNKKHDYKENVTIISSVNKLVSIDGSGGQSTRDKRKVD